MKKKYENPTIQKIAFSYRDQVVAASGNPLPDNAINTGNNNGGGSGTGNAILDYIYDRLPGGVKDVVDLIIGIFG